MNDNNNKLKIPLYNILKLEADDILKHKIVEPKIKANGKKFNDISYRVPEVKLEEIIKSKKGLVSVADHFVFREIRKLNGDNTTQSERLKALNDIKLDIRLLKKFDKLTDKYAGELLKNDIYFDEDINFLCDRINLLHKSKATLISKIDELEKKLFVPEMIAVKVSKTKYEKFAKKGFYYGDTLFSRFCASSGNLKNNIVIFVADTVNRVITENLKCGHKDIISSCQVVSSKYGAYLSLSTTGCSFISSPRVLVVPDYTHIMIDDEVNYVEEKENEQGITYYDVTKKKYSEVGGALNSFDGQGVASPDWVEHIAKNELGLDYIPSAMNARCVGVKGLLVTFPFKEMAKDNYMVDNLKGDTVDIRYYDVVLTESQWKYHDLYDNDFNVYEQAHKDNELVWGVQSIAPKVDKDITKLNYQLLQTSNLCTDEDIEEVLKPTKDYYKKLSESDDVATMYHLFKDDILSNEIEEIKGSSLKQAIKIDNSLLQDSYVKEMLYDSIRKSFKMAKAGKIIADPCNYQFMISDPYALCQWVIFRDEAKVTGLVPAKSCYSKYWIDKGITKIDACRSPMTDISEHNILNVTDNSNEKFEDMQRWYKHITSGIVYSIYDLSTIIHSDSDL